MTTTWAGFPGADGRQAGLSFTDRHGVKQATHRLQGKFNGCGFEDPDHSWEGGRTDPDSTIFAALSKAGVSNHYYFTDIPVSALWGQPGLSRSSQVQSFYEQAAAGTLPALSFVDPSFNGESSTRTSGRWASASRRSSPRPTPGAATSITRSTASSRS